MTVVSPCSRTWANPCLLHRARRLLATRYYTSAVAASTQTVDPAPLDTDVPLSIPPSFLTDLKPGFEPRREFPSLPSLPRSYFLGHHAAGLDRIRALLSQIDIVVECRDARVPFTGSNPLLEQTLSDFSNARRIICYTKRDLVAPTVGSGKKDAMNRERVLRRWHEQGQRKGRGEIVCFSSAARVVNGKIKDEGIVGKEVMAAVKKIARERWSLTGLRILVAGMPNVGKSTLLNALRARGVKKGKTARTGADPGVTRKVGGWVKILEGWEIDAADAQGSRGSTDETLQAKSQSEGVYVCDSPGIFMPYVPSSTAMLKLALVGAVKDHSDIIHPVTLADYLLFHWNLNPEAIEAYTKKFSLPGSSPPSLQPTNDIMELLQAVAERIGRRKPGGKLDIEGTATWLVKKWRAGELGRFSLDEVSEDAVQALVQEEAGQGKGPVSISQAKRFEKEKRKERGRARHAAMKAQAS